jgi:hypothetical protein
LWTADRDYALLGKTDVSSPIWNYAVVAPSFYTNFQFYMDLPTTNYSAQFFRLRHNWSGVLLPIE